MKNLLIIGLIAVLSCPLIARDGDLEVNTGFSTILYQSVYSFQPGTALETMVGEPLADRLMWQTGARLGLNPVKPEGFLRMLIAPEIGYWRPNVGLEFGITARARFDEGDKLLRETRTAMEKDISPFYAAVHAAPLSFKLKDKWRLSLVEINIGTHLGYIGRTMRLQLVLISLGKVL
ncbi:MAG: hypothetical protein GF313_11820 [Caldithrix sp.]|nr:hypothetical protein [Caldithrix sp.]